MDEFEGQDNDLSNDDYEPTTLPSKTFEVKQGRIINKIDGLAAMKQAINKILSTERFVLTIYNENYGHDLPDLIGKDLEYIKTEAERMVTEALEADDRVTGVDINNVEQVKTNVVQITGDVETIFGNLSIAKEVDTN